ncbi:hypothetical protein LTR62_000122 [Meristemomyces frigidus]|uniref:Protein kinase domain-containing protein n=1 Tax=Meristemomyces frigidus TaxID=1508187 RepID=A0AAN7TXI1_9PEZI|nr:hypothetical protein LTR62_000122 [Meristemomyces frigidus]
MAAYDIQQHFKGLRADTGLKKGRRNRDPFATGFEDDSEEEAQRHRRRDRVKPSEKKAKPVSAVPSGPGNASILDQLRDSDDEWLGVSQKRTDRRPSPAPAQVASLRVSDGAGRRGSVDKGLQSGRPSRSAIAQAAGQLAYLDDSSDEGPPTTKRSDRRPSPAPRKDSDTAEPGERSSTPRGGRAPLSEQVQGRVQPSKHTVASAFAGTKYLQDSDSSADEDEEEEETAGERKGSTDSATSPDTLDTLNPWESALPSASKHLEVKRVDKPKPQNGSGISWRAFSASRIEQRSAEIEALQASLRQRGNSIAFTTHAVTDDGKKVPIAIVRKQSSATRGRGKGRGGGSPPRRNEDVQPGEDDLGGDEGVYDPREYKTNPFTGVNRSRGQSPIQTRDQASARPSQVQNFPTSESTTSRMLDEDLQSPHSPTIPGAMTSSTESILSKLVVSPQTIPEGKTIEHSVASLADISGALSRNSSVQSTRSRPARVPRRPSRRNTSNNPSISPAQAFLGSWTRDSIAAEPVAPPQADEEGQSFGMDPEYVIGRLINTGGFGVIKEARTIYQGQELVRAVKIVRKQHIEGEDRESDKAQQALEHEVSVWRHLDHRHILKLHVTFETDFATFCVMDLNTGGTLFDTLRKARRDAAQNDGRKGLAPALARSYAYQLACALRYLHQDMRVCHRDVKLENCLIDSTNPYDPSIGAGTLRLCDFGLADFLNGDAGMDDFNPAPLSPPGASESSEKESTTHIRASSIIGTLEYASPRGLSVDRKLFETAGDIWAYGVIVYALCTGELPFRHAMPSRTAEMILRADWDLDALKGAAAAGGMEVVELVGGCLERDVDVRITVGEVVAGKWFEGLGEEGGEVRGLW